MKENGIPDENIIYMTYDDMANNRLNPLKGQLFNYPNGPNVYDQSVIDYSGTDVNPENFLAVLKNDAATASGPVLDTCADSKIFVNFVDHGAPGFLIFSGSNLYADDLQSAIDYMTDNKLFKEMVFYIEACESGSMFPNL